MLLLIIFGLIVVVWLYLMFFRDRINRELVGSGYHYLWLRSRTILVGRLYWIVGIVIGIHEIAISAGFDFTPIYRELSNLFPERYQSLSLSLFLYVTGIVMIKLRKIALSEEREGKKRWAVEDSQ